MRVEVYRNLRTGTWSVRQAGGKVLRRPRAVFLTDCTFVVQPAGRARVLTTGRKNVHAFVRGTDNHAPSIPPAELLRRLESGVLAEVTYNPFKAGTFVLRALPDRPVYTAECAWLVDGRVFIPVTRG